MFLIYITKRSFHIKNIEIQMIVVRKIRLENKLEKFMKATK